MNTYKQSYLSPTTTNCLKGIMALVIVACHLRNNLVWLNDTVIGQLLTASGYLCVAVFFFFSGYGVMYQYKQRGTAYIDAFPKRRVLDIYIKYLLLILLYATMQILQGTIPTTLLIVQSLFFGNTLVYSGWYLQALLLLYMLFYLVFKCLPHAKSYEYVIGFASALAIYCALCWLFECSFLWYQSPIGFFLGLWVAWNKDTIDRVLSDKHFDLVLLLFAFVAFCITVLLGNLLLLPIPLQYFSKILSAAFFVTFVLLSLRFIKIENRITAWLGKISFEIYIIHGVFLNLLLKEPMYINDGFYIIAVLACSCLAAIPLHQVFVLISKWLKHSA